MIFPGQEQPSNKRTVGQIESSPVPGWWIVVDNRGYKHKAASLEQWKIGDSVVILSDQIVARAGKTTTPVEYQV